MDSIFFATFYLHLEGKWGHIKMGSVLIKLRNGDCPHFLTILKKPQQLKWEGSKKLFIFIRFKKFKVNIILTIIIS